MRLVDRILPAKAFAGIGVVGWRIAVEDRFLPVPPHVPEAEDGFTGGGPESRFAKATDVEQDYINELVEVGGWFTDEHGWTFWTPDEK